MKKPALLRRIFALLYRDSDDRIGQETLGELQSLVRKEMDLLVVKKKMTVEKLDNGFPNLIDGKIWRKWDRKVKVK